MAADALAKTRTSNRAGEVGPDIYAEWRASTLGAITESLEHELVLDLAGSLFGKSVLDVGCGTGRSRPNSTARVHHSSSAATLTRT